MRVKKRSDEVREVESFVEEVEPAPKASKPVVKPSLLSDYMEEYPIIGGFKVGSGFKRWCQLKDPTLLERRLPEEEWAALYQEFITREVR